MNRIWMAAAVAGGLAATAGASRADFGGPVPGGAPPGMSHGGMPGMPPGGMGGMPPGGMGYGAPGCGPGGCGDAAVEGDKYGVHPIFRRLMFWRKDRDGAGLGHRAGKLGGRGGCPPQAGAGAGAGPFDPYGGQVPGTLVFPQHPFARSPRDFFMYEPNRP